MNIFRHSKGIQIVGAIRRGSNSCTILIAGHTVVPQAGGCAVTDRLSAGSDDGGVDEQESARLQDAIEQHQQDGQGDGKLDHCLCLTFLWSKLL